LAHCLADRKGERNCSSGKEDQARHWFVKLHSGDLCPCLQVAAEPRIARSKAFDQRLAAADHRRLRLSVWGQVISYAAHTPIWHRLFVVEVAAAVRIAGETGNGHERDFRIWVQGTRVEGSQPDILAI
jgi:hypothetical protein